jgi:hypothetical protein
VTVLCASQRGLRSQCQYRVPEAERITRRALRVRGLTGPAAQWQDALSAQLQTPISQSRTNPKSISASVQRRFLLPW